ncbi:acyl-CoA dehydrogenase [Ramlibacter sp. AW1]|uniref:Acyl-CoA dehydrogenase n=1 Tax=Ramlibacter aurantiacus TaxID=2801330 RepID=A0A937D3F9_9BURK|nr:acyl-CoA dehydrogenase [Ramlibacter aurantiacus]MBL0419302.1 acyl-CoA dehydrogenase [Ramlibacter aurantiacus]
MDDHRELLKDSVRAFMAGQGGRARARALRDAASQGSPGEHDRAHWRQLGELGCLGALAPQAQGGLELDVGDVAGMVQEMGRALAPEPFVQAAVGAVGLLSLVAHSPLADTLLPRIIQGRLIPQLAWTGPGQAEPAPGSARLVPADGHALLQGLRHEVLPGQGDGWLVLAQSGGAPVLCWVPAGTAGVTAVVHERVDGTTHAEVRFDRVRIEPRQQASGPLLNEHTITRVADNCRLCTAAELLGAAEPALQATLHYLRTRKQFGRPIGSFQALQHRAVDLYAQQRLAQAAIDSATSAARAGEAWSIACSRAKARATRAALAICREAVQMHGAMGFADECEAGLHLKRALGLAAWLGNEPAQRARVAGLLSRRGEMAGDEPAAIRTTTRMDWKALDDEEFRLRVRDVFEREYPEELRNPPRRLRWHECRRFYQRLGELGLLAIAWPQAFGGAALPPGKQLIFMQEQDRWGVARAPDMGITMVGPGLIRYGTPAQRDRYLPAILRFEHMWCQGFSEPDAGSDLASLRTRAVRDGGDYVIDGAKIWTTFAQDATHMFMLARTDPTAKKQAGISMLLIDLATPGITIRPIRDIAGNDEFCEVRFDGVRVPLDALLGQENDGWTVAKSILASERIYLGNPRQSQNALKRLDAAAASLGLRADPVFMDRLTDLRLDVWDLVSLFESFAAQVQRGEPLGPDVSILKLIGSETYQRLAQLGIEALGADGARTGAVRLGEASDDLMSLFMNSRPATIYGGSSEVQRNVLAKHVLALPDA